MRATPIDFLLFLKVLGKPLERDKVLGREVRMDLTATRPHIKRIAHPDAVAANERDEDKADSRWVVVAKNPGDFMCQLCGATHPKPQLAHTYRSCFKCSGVMTQPRKLHEEVLSSPPHERTNARVISLGTGCLCASARRLCLPAA